MNWGFAFGVVLAIFFYVMSFFAFAQELRWAAKQEDQKVALPFFALFLGSISLFIGLVA